MKSLTLKECIEKNIPPEQIKPDDVALWDKVSLMFSNDAVKVANIYESMGGTFSRENVQMCDDDNDLEEELDMCPYDLSPAMRRRMKRLKKRGSYSADRMTSWD